MRVFWEVTEQDIIPEFNTSLRFRRKSSKNEKGDVSVPGGILLPGRSGVQIPYSL